MTIKASEILEPLPLSRLLFELCDMASAVTFEREDDGGLIVAVKNGPKGTYALRMTKRQVDDHDHTWLRVLAGYLHQQVLLDHAKGHPRQTQGPRAGSDPRRAPAAGPGRPDRTRTKTQSRRKKT